MTTPISPYYASIPSHSEDKLFAASIAVWVGRHHCPWGETTITDLAIQEARDAAAREKLIRDTFTERADNCVPLGLLLTDDHLYELPRAEASVLRADLLVQIAEFLRDLYTLDLLNRSSDVQSASRVLTDLSEAFRSHHSRQMLEAGSEEPES